MRYAATVNGPPAIPMTAALGPIPARVKRIASATNPRSASASIVRRPRTSVAERIGRAMTGPVGASSSSTPIAWAASMTSAKSTAPSVPSRSAASRVTSADSSGVLAMCMTSCRSRSLRYPGSEPPDCRMNHTGVASTSSRRQPARNRSAPVTRDLPPPAPGPCARGRGQPAAAERRDPSSAARHAPG